ncbi:hypothetical protein K438DRAFT_1836165 [Mycena galopus ATCC 62051]|nr:hypothetical protein K438DRAFT_1836165 [Mycena galopus ATCC 62051]
MPRHCSVLQVVYCSPLQTSTAALPSPLPFTLHQPNAATSASIGAGVDEHAFYPSHVRQSQVRSPSRSKRLIVNSKHPRYRNVDLAHLFVVTYATSVTSTP